MIPALGLGDEGDPPGPRDLCGLLLLLLVVDSTSMDWGWVRVGTRPLTSRGGEERKKGRAEEEDDAPRGLSIQQYDTDNWAVASWDFLCVPKPITH